MQQFSAATESKIWIFKLFLNLNKPKIWTFGVFKVLLQKTKNLGSKTHFYNPVLSTTAYSDKIGLCHNVLLY